MTRRDTNTSSRMLGYLPGDVPPPGALISLGFQHVLTMFPATALVAIITGFDVAVTVFASGLATIVAALGSRNRIPLYYGGSFAYLAAVVAVVNAEWGGTEVAQVGVVATGIVNILVGLVIKRAGKESLDRILPPTVTGSIAIVIGIALAREAVDMATANWTIAIITLLLTIMFSVYLRGLGLLGMLPVLLGAVCGYIIAALAGEVTFSPVAEAAWFGADALPETTTAPTVRRVGEIFGGGQPDPMW